MFPVVRYIEIFSTESPNNSHQNDTACKAAGYLLVPLKVHKIEIFFDFDFEICIISLLVM